ncbi:hypothetical protein DID88_008821 [Monilinia fructigena]|nr:hypothetical protein DID88_008821 [Monilinia fructigena]
MLKAEDPMKKTFLSLSFLELIWSLFGLTNLGLIIIARSTLPVQLELHPYLPNGTQRTNIFPPAWQYSLPTHNQPQIPPQTVNSEDLHRPKNFKTLNWKNSLLNSVQSSHIKTRKFFGKLLTNIKTLPPKSKLILVSGVRPDILKGGYRDPYTRIHYATHNTGPKFNHNGDKGVKREEPPIPVEAV